MSSTAAATTTTTTTSATPGTPRRPFHIAIIENDIATPETRHHYGGYGGVIRSLIKKTVPILKHNKDLSPQGKLDIELVTAEDYEESDLAELSRPGAVVVKTSVWALKAKGELPDISDVDALWLSGSQFCAADSPQWTLDLVALLKAALDPASPVRVVGMCFGHQVIARALGAKVEPNPAGWEVSVVETILTDEGREVFRFPVSLKHSAPDLANHPDGPGPDGLVATAHVYQMHHDHVVDLPKGAVLMASSDRCPIHSYMVPDKVLTTQGHPEFTRSIVGELLDVRHEAGILPKADYEDGKIRLRDRDDGVAMALGMIRFLLRGWITDKDDKPADKDDKPAAK